MMKHALFILACLVSLNSVGEKLAGHGIQFHHGDWQSARNKAKEENKFIFIDFYTQWCGPCLNMAETVFTQSFVGDFYNKTFVNMKIDAEHGEGLELAKRYGVHSYPTYVFVDPETGSAIHVSKSRQSAEQFLMTGKNALNPETRSGYLLEEFEKGRKDRKFLLDYIHYQSSIYGRAQVLAAFELLLSGGAEMSEPDIWTIFDQHITGTDNKYFSLFVENYETFCRAVGKKAADHKLYRETRYCNIGQLDSLPDFEGKNLNRAMIGINTTIRDLHYEKADSLIRATMADSAIDRQEFIAQLKYAVRNSFRQADTPLPWLTKCASYMQFIAYNDVNRDDAFIHQEYAALLERLIRLTPGAEKIFPESILKIPEFGCKEYNMRPHNLAPKPNRKKESR